MSSDKTFLKVEEVSEIYGIPIGGLRGLLFRRKENGLDKAIIKLGRRILIHRTTFENFLLDHREAGQIEETKNS